MKLNPDLMDDLRLNYHPPPPPQPPATAMANNGGAGDLTEAKSTKFLRIIEEESNSSSSSSIGNNSDDDDDEGDREEDAQSPYRFNDDDNQKVSTTGSLDDAIQALEQALPIRRGISTFYDGKSKSFACLANMWHSSTPSITDIAKPDNAFNRKRRNLLATKLLSHKNKNRAFPLSNTNTGRISKKPKTATFHFTSEKVASEKEDTDVQNPIVQNPSLSSMRSFSMVNLHRCSSRFGLKSTEIENC